MPRVDPGRCEWLLPDPTLAAPGSDVVGVGADLAPATLLAAYAAGLFPMHLADGQLGWWSPDPRGVLLLDDLRITRSLRKSVRRFTVTFDRDFEAVIRACGDRPADAADESWINDDIVRAYCELHRLGWAHSVEVWHDGALVGGLYGVEIGGLFAGESMFHRERDASKVALLALVDRLSSCAGLRIVDVQWSTPHLKSLGVVDLDRDDYLDLLDEALATHPCFTE